MEIYRSDNFVVRRMVKKALLIIGLFSLTASLKANPITSYTDDGFNPKMATQNGQAAIAYQTFEGFFLYRESPIYLWKEAGGQTTKIVENSAAIHELVNINGKLHLSYTEEIKNQSNLDEWEQNIKVWIEGAGESTIDTVIGKDDRTGNPFGVPYNAMTSLNNLAVVGFTHKTDQLRLWFDNGFGGGTAGDGLVNGSEIRSLIGAGTPSIDQVWPLDMEVYNGNIALCYLTREAFGTVQMMIWVDDGRGGGVPGDMAMNGAESSRNYVPSI